jgi:predicted chitinase
MKPLVSVDELRKLMPNLSLGKAGYYAPFLNAAMLEQEIISKRRRCAFLAQLAHESAQLRYMEEIASGAAYEGRTDLGNIRPGDGKRYKGRGPIQLTGRANYRLFGRLLGLDLEGNPQIAAKPENGFRIAALFWKRKKLNDLADQLTLKGDKAERTTFMEITKRINGGHNGLNDRLNYFRIAKQLLHNDEDEPSPVAPSAVRPAESVKEQEESESAGSQAVAPAEVSAESGETDLLGAAVTSPKAKGAALKLWPRLVKHSSAGVTFIWAIVEANKVASVLVLLVIAAGIGWLLYHNRKKLAPHVLKLLK